MSSRGGPGRGAARALAAWYRKHARDLPWRRDSGPYQVLVSEIMLQQTTVEVVVPYYGRFMERFPDAGALAAAREEELLALWSGLGYYRRARSLQAAARAMVAGHEGRVPATREELLALPGIGPYTASAILAIAHGMEAVALDGNLKRVLSRLAGYDGPTESAAGSRALEAAGSALLPGADPSVINQALMDLGASHCGPRSPRCGPCPVRDHCRARRDGSVDRIPSPRRRVEPVEVRLAAAIIPRGDRLLLRRRSGRLMSGMWEFPMVETGRGARTRPGKDEAALAAHLREAGLRPGELTATGQVRHSITRHRIRVSVYRGAASGRLVARSVAAGEPGRSDLSGEGAGTLEWIRGEELEGLPLTGLARKISRRLAERGQGGPAGGGRKGVRHPGSEKPSSAR